ncbi:SGNH hydrolase-type esterase domain-containing protein [Artemisia annua]|uniref:SGNH hydrolase-type esterase domain-containing protein n=1 Tax=Artemisia annua TaxID=35608 RepID=A0A2U1MSX0_ARTAN|nr:SGNH hydrolase-type esterase domain-containing protein [Artemisia annua]
MSLTTLVSILLFLFSNFATRAQSSLLSGPLTKNAPRAFFVFGDSLVDNGNNNFLLSIARADAPPYGIDHPSHRPTGRFSNGRNIPDLIGEQIGVEPLLPYLDPELNCKKLLKGANFASAGIGILNDTGFHFVNIIRMPDQLTYFEEYQNRVAALIGAEKTHKLINKALVLITCGGNDFVNNYYLVRHSLRSFQYRLPDENTPQHLTTLTLFSHTPNPRIIFSFFSKLLAEIHHSTTINHHQILILFKI